VTTINPLATATMKSHGRIVTPMEICLDDSVQILSRIGAASKMLLCQPEVSSKKHNLYGMRF